ncbi:hypothetical protein CROQUDRAFT_136175 [Cronartium quercuum f. sp. fusiforme G11]|uniref:Uncharacterized protein n=1 Tax=Cronartium quercuum f. sp. fusiforme G11 TaxID=708437 RepID=A0A9P6T704_9BASI|nr:hypothetical protein CROQUDRAFT_136175 [Cronartium quercuum f. sp. fusiforme G11]
MSFTEECVKLPELKDGVFPNWNKRLHFVLKSRGLFHFLTSDVLPEDEDKLLTYRRLRGRVMVLIVNSLDATNDALIQFTDTRKQAYNKLRKAHGSSGGVLAAATICEIATARMLVVKALKTTFVSVTCDLSHGV